MMFIRGLVFFVLHASCPPGTLFPSVALALTLARFHVRPFHGDPAFTVLIIAHTVCLLLPGLAIYDLLDHT
ncbi:hypothetical protein EV126DRAFT_424869 [Verticillium dahliae]|nr:hypothetical protein EV126DRAFT_424869 [Verticillium dahliae]